MESSRDKPAQDTVRLPKDIVAELRRADGSGPRISLLVYHRDGAEIVPLRSGGSVIVGRDHPATVRIQDTSLSREHARFSLLDGRVTVEDLGSTNGTWLAGLQIERRELGPDDEVQLGGVTAMLHAPTPDAGDVLAIESHDRFRTSLEQEVVRARFFGQKLGVLMVRAAGKGAHVSRWCPGLRRFLRPVDRMALYSPDAIEILLPEADARTALAIGRAIVDAHATGESRLFCGVATLPEVATVAEKLLELCWDAARRATEARPVEMATAGSWRPGDAVPVARGDDEPICGTPAMRELFAAVARLARSTIPVLLTGETGTGKEVLARALHRGGPRREHPMVCVNCGAIPQQLVESTLFGHERGSFTGATQQQKGVFEAASGGTVLLDEIGELPLAVQAVLLRVLETKRIARVGSSKELEVDVRVIAATHRDLEAMSEAGTFREDLLYRLNAMTLMIPPLRERTEEIEPLVERFLRQANEANGASVQGVEPEAMALLESYAWPGNVRELRNAVERAVVIARGDRVAALDLPERVRAGGDAARHAQPPASVPMPREEPDDDPSSALGDDPGGIKARLKQYETQIILAALKECDWNQTEAAKRLAMPLRTLVHRMKVLNLRKLGYGPEGGG